MTLRTVNNIEVVYGILCACPILAFVISDLIKYHSTAFDGMLMAAVCIVSIVLSVAICILRARNHSSNNRLFTLTIISNLILILIDYLNIICFAYLFAPEECDDVNFTSLIPLIIILVAIRLISIYTNYSEWKKYANGKQPTTGSLKT